MITLPSLYPHQTDHNDRTRAALARHGRVIVSAPPGVGKTRMAKWILGASANREPTARQTGRSLFTVHRRGLVDNAIESFEEHPAVPHGVIMSGRETAYGRRIQIASIDTMLSWFVEDNEYPSDITFDLIVWDEAHAHHPKFAKLLKYHDAQREKLNLHPAYVIGLTATPQAKGLADVYREIVQGPATQWLIDNKYLSPFRYFRATEGKLGLLVKRGGEFTKGSVCDAMDGLAGDLVRDWKQYAEGRPTVGFFPRRSHAKDAMIQLEDAGLRVEYVDGNTPDENRRMIFRWLNNHDIDYLCNVQVVERGTDIPRIGCVQLCVAVGSIVRYRQLIGRGSRVHPDKTDCLVLDHGGNIKRHGFFEDDPAWSLDITTKDPGEAGVRPTIECPKCCVAAGTMILTDRGEVPIQDVLLSDRVWDGVEFCSHAGTTCNGIKKVIKWGSLSLTPDHKVLTNDGWKEAQAAKDNGCRPVSGGMGGTPIRTVDDSNPYYPLPRVEPRSRSGLCALREKRVAAVSQNDASHSSWMRALHGEVRGKVPGVACAESQPAAVALPVSTTPCLQDLRRTWNRVPVCIGNRRSTLDCGKSGAATEQIVDNRPHRQQRTLRSRKLAVGHNADASSQPRCRLAGTIPRDLSFCNVLRDATNEPAEARVDPQADRGPLDHKVRDTRNVGMAGETETGLPVCEIQQTPTDLYDAEGIDTEANSRPLGVEVWDILNAGPRNRYCANGTIVSNCAIYRGGKCKNCGYEPTPRERRAQGLQFDGSELREVKREEKKANAKTAEDLMVSALYMAGRSGRTWRQCVGIFKNKCEKQGTPHRVPRTVAVGDHKYEMIRYGSDDANRRVAMLYPFVRGEHGGKYLVKETQTTGTPY